MTRHLKCFGTIFPDLNHLEANKTIRGRVFSITVRGSGIGTQGREITADEDAWEECGRCRSYRSCYDLSMGRLALEQALLAKS